MRCVMIIRVFESFEEIRVAVDDGVQLRVRHGGRGEPVVLLHGHPRTHTTWHRVAPLLVTAGHTVVCPDLRGYGQSSTPPTTPDHAPYSKRALAADVLSLMRQLGHRAVRRRRSRPRELRRDAPGPRRTGGRDPPRRSGQRPDRRDTRSHRRQVRHGVVALVLLRPARQARAGDPRRP